MSSAPPIDIDTLRSITKTYGVTIDPKDEEAYHNFLNALNASSQRVEALPSYTDPRLLPSRSTLPRTYNSLAGNAEKNPLNAWSHQTSVTSTAPLDEKLKGRTIVVKDNTSIARLPLTGGTVPQVLTGKSEYPIPEIDAPVVQRVLENGATLRGSATCEHFSLSPLSCTSASGPVHNAWLKGYTAGGSSSGCGATVAATQVRAWKKKHGLPANDADLGESIDMAIGGDQGGSIRIPAAYGGIYGLKPTHGLVPYTGMMGLIPMIDHAGPMTTTLEDNALLLSVMAGWDGIDPRSTPETPLRENVLDYLSLLEAWKAEKKEKGEWNAESAGLGLRIGVLTEGLEAQGLSSEVKAVIESAIGQFKAIGADVQTVSIPMHTAGPAIWTVATQPWVTRHGLQNRVTPLLHYPMPDIAPPPFDQRAFEVLHKHNPAMSAMFFHSAFLESRPDATQLVAKAMGLAQQLRDAYDEVLEDFDVLLTPVNPRVGSRHPGYEDSVGEKIMPAVGATQNTCQFNLTGHPALAMPAGWGKVPDGPGRLPVGMQLVGKRFDEMGVFKVAAAWEVGGKGIDGWNGQSE